MRVWFAVIVGIGGLAILLSLGVWQLQRLQEKQALLQDIDARIAADPVALPETLDPDLDRYLPVAVTGKFRAQDSAHMLASRRRTGAVHRHIVAFDTEDGTEILVDVGWTDARQTQLDLPEDQIRLVGNLDWPRETDGFTPEPDLTRGQWFARDVLALSQELGTEEILLVLRMQPDAVKGVTPWPVDSANVPNDHLQYAITWFSLAAIWAGMTAYFLLRRERAAPKES